MAIKIISKGKELDNPIFTQRCPNCDCVFIYQNEDAHREPTGRYYKDFEEYFIKIDKKLQYLLNVLGAIKRFM